MFMLSTPIHCYPRGVIVVHVCRGKVGAITPNGG
jgi:hypothetical protein